MEVQNLSNLTLWTKSFSVTNNQVNQQQYINQSTTIY